MKLILYHVMRFEPMTAEHFDQLYNNVIFVTRLFSYRPI